MTRFSIELREVFKIIATLKTISKKNSFKSGAFLIKIDSERRKNFEKQKNQKKIFFVLSKIVKLTGGFFTLVF